MSTCSADEALYELLGVDRLSLIQDEPDENDTLPVSSASSLVLSPPPHCHRPATSHTPLLLQTACLLSKAQCHYIVFNLGYRATNNGGESYGPRYVKAAASDISSSAQVELRDPNHHKVCVFTSDMVFKWIQTAFRDHVNGYIDAWCRDNHLDSMQYTVNPRLRLLR